MTEDGFEIGFDAANLETSLAVSGFLSPFLPQVVAKGVCVVSLTLVAAIHLLFWFKRSKALRSKTETGLGSVLVSDAAETSFNLSTHTIALLVIAMAWLHFSGGLWVLGNFVILFVSAHCLCTTHGSVMDLVDIRELEE